MAGVAAARKAAEEVARQYGRGPIALLKQGWNEIPEILATSAMAFVGTCFGMAGIYKYFKTDGDNREFKTHYTIMRPDDRRADRVRRLLEKEKAKAEKK